MMSAMLFLLSAAAAPAVSTTPAAAPLTEIEPRTMRQAEIRAHNAQLARTDPNYIRCVKREDIGSLVKRHFSCRTNRQWRLAEDSANTEARAIADEMSSKSWRTSG
jgi:hypothetical protein